MTRDNWYNVSLFPGFEKSNKFIIFLAEGTTLEHFKSFWVKYFGEKFDFDGYFKLLEGDISITLPEIEEYSHVVVVTSDVNVFSNPLAQDHIILAIDHPNRIVQSLLHLNTTEESGQ